MEKRYFTGNVYESPQMRIVEIRSEGLLCQSGIVEEWQEEELEW